MPPWPGIDEDHRLGVVLRLVRGVGERLRRSRRLAAAALTSGPGAELRGRRRRDLDGELHTALARLHLGLADDHGRGRIEHDARLAFGEQPEAEGGDQPAPELARSGGQPKGDVGKVDDDAVGIGQREDLGLHAGGEVEPEGRRGGASGQLGAAGLDGSAALPVHAARALLRQAHRGSGNAAMHNLGGLRELRPTFGCQDGPWTQAKISRQRATRRTLAGCTAKRATAGLVLAPQCMSCRCPRPGPRISQLCAFSRLEFNEMLADLASNCMVLAEKFCGAVVITRLQAHRRTRTY